MSLRSQIRRLAARTTGMGTDEVFGFTIHQVGVACQAMAKTGELHRAVVSVRHVRYFTQVGMRDAYVRELNAVAPLQARGSKAPWTVDTPAIYPTDANGEPAYKFTLCPPYNPRFAPVDLPGRFTANQRGRVLHGGGRA